MAKHQNDNSEVTENTTPVAVPTKVTGMGSDPNKVLAHIVKEDDGYHLINLSDGVKSDVLKIIEDGRTLVLPVNDSNRKWMVVAKADAEIEKNGFVALTYKATKVLGPVGRRIPNEKLLAYLTEDEANEVKAIINEAYDRMEAEKAANKKPVTDIDKVKAKIEKLQKQLAEAEKAMATTENN